MRIKCENGLRGVYTQISTARSPVIDVVLRLSTTQDSRPLFHERRSITTFIRLPPIRYVTIWRQRVTIMTWKDWILICLFANCLSAAPDRYYGYHGLIEKKEGNIFVAALCNRAGHYIFVLWFLLLPSIFYLLFLFSRLISAVADV